jgi:hypothetical protein
MAAAQSGKKFIYFDGQTALYRTRKSFLNPNFHNECFRLSAERETLLHSMNRVPYDLLCGTKMTESKINFTTACDNLMTSESCDWIELNTVNPNFAFMPTGKHTEQKITCDHILNQFSH